MNWIYPNPKYKPPFPWFGGKSRIATHVWARLGDVPNYVEPFFGSGAVLFARPHEPHTETVNDLDGMLANFWRAVASDPDAVAGWCDWPVNECDLHARHIWLRGQRSELVERLEADPLYYDAQIAGWWCWGLCCWIGHGWCDAGSTGPWHIEDGRLVRGAAGQGVMRQLPHLGGAKSVTRQIHGLTLPQWFGQIQDRLRRVRVCCGDWTRVCTPAVTTAHGLTGVFLDPPYSASERDPKLYAEESITVAHDCRKWALENGDNPKMRIALCGYEGEHDMPDTWECLAWKGQGGYGNGSKTHDNPNCHRKRIWFSPHCLHLTDSGEDEKE